jgi:hypothetical protein
VAENGQAVTGVASDDIGDQSLEREDRFCETDHLSDPSNPYLTPELTPPPAAALLAATIRNSIDDVEVRQQGNMIASVGGLRIRDFRSLDFRFSNWKAAFNVGRLVTPIGQIKGEKVSKAGLVRVVKTARSAFTGPDSKDQALQPGCPPVSPGKGSERLKSKHRRDLPSPPKSHKELRTHILGKEFREVEKAHLKGHEDSRTWKEVQTANQKGIIDCM